MAALDHVKIRDKVATLLGRIVDEPDLKLDDLTVADDVDGWDSISHVKLIISLERAYGIRFEPDEISSPENVGQLVNLVSRHLEQK